MKRIAEASPRFKARIAGALFLLGLLSAVFGEFFVRRLVLAADLIAVAGCVVRAESCGAPASGKGDGDRAIGPATEVFGRTSFRFFDPTRRGAIEPAFGSWTPAVATPLAWLFGRS